MRKKRICYIISVATLVFLVGFSSGYLYRKYKGEILPILVRPNTFSYKFVNPIVFLQVPEDDSTLEFQSLRKDILNYVNENIDKNNAEDVSVYFRDLNTARWIGINSDDKYSPASMLKVASMIAFLRAEEENPNLFYKRIILNFKDDNNSIKDYFPSKHQTENGATYTTDELLSYMIVDSDNNALNAIDSLTGNKILKDTYDDMRIPIVEGGSGNDFLSVKMYSRLFRSLYNGSYISQNLSEKALDLLSKTNFDKGLVSSLPKGVVVSHKFGERTLKKMNQNLSIVDGSNYTEVKELHDCGIVYAPKDPYFICVMTKGKDFNNLQKIISDISGIAWKKVQNS